MPTVRYIVDDVDPAVDFYLGRLGFALAERLGPPFAIVERDGLRLWLSGPGTSARRPMPSGAAPAPGGWNRLVIEVGDIAATVAALRAAGATFRNEPLTGPGGTQVLVEGPSGNAVEIFQPA
ncbi:MAG: VOC family protein [Chloroflexi bacterium]|nr:VOC family protein [Chloroflexota bacterium]